MDIASISTEEKNNKSSLFEKISRILQLVLLAILPLSVIPLSFVSLSFGKISLFTSLVIISFVLFLVKSIKQGKFELQSKATLIGLAIVPAVVLNPTNLLPLVLIARLYIYAGDSVKAKEFITKVLALKQDYTEALTLLEQIQQQNSSRQTTSLQTETVTATATSSKKQ